MTDTDIRLSGDWQLTQAADGDVPLCSGLDAVYQGIALEAVTQTGNLFFDQDFGWGLQEFIQSEDDELLRMEITTRAMNRLRRVGEIDPASVEVSVQALADTYHLSCRFRFAEEREARALDIVISAVDVEVETLDR